MSNKELGNAQSLVNALLEQCKELFKFNGEVAKQLFLNDSFNIVDKVDISVNRKYFTEVIKYIPNQYVIEFHDDTKVSTSLRETTFNTITHANVFLNDEMILTVLVYDTINEEWLFRLDHNIRFPEKHIYFHSITWDVDYIKPEIVLMYELLDPIDYHQLPNYKKVIDALSYYQFVLLRVVVGDERIHQALISEKNAM
ncbi:hypothetical protein NW126_00390 [Staphylococcus pettenkoferi]|uniref:hypothetical protein n=1 Tax=Staphylococcus pettenkoferi TaxID=170573 RepID=UPI002273B294|nr:hypothetical protein [Staphylococcus pettenkoferi]MCY1565965.1 hypothetical protein [Staphylococcus pettenkoferi]MCY1587158.1 hypothetical protein [Staphylococcus pettenkoferi]